MLTSPLVVESPSKGELRWHRNWIGSSCSLTARASALSWFNSGDSLVMSDQWPSFAPLANLSSSPCPSR